MSIDAEGTPERDHTLPEVLWDEIHVGEVVRATPKTLQSWRCKGTGPPYVKLNHLVRYRPSDVRRWLESKIRRSTSE